MADRAMHLERIGEMGFLDEIQVHVRDQPAHPLFLRMASQMMVEPDAGRFEYAGDRHIVDVAHRVDVLEAGVDAGDETISCRAKAPRSEENTSELQSLMRISYAVFCL